MPCHVWKSLKSLVQNALSNRDSSILMVLMALANQNSAIASCPTTSGTQNLTANKNFLLPRQTANSISITFDMTLFYDSQPPSTITHPSRFLGYHYHILLKLLPSFTEHQDTPWHLSPPPHPKLDLIHPIGPLGPLSQLSPSFSSLLWWRSRCRSRT